MSVDDLVQDSELSLLRRIFAEEWPTIGNHGISVGLSMSASAGFSHIAEGSDMEIATSAALIDVVVYWGTLLGQFAWRDRKKIRDENNSLDGKKILKKITEYGVTGALLETTYLASRIYLQQRLQREGFDPATASATVQATLASLYTFALPPIRYALRQWSEK